MSRGLNWLQALAGGQALAGYPASVKVVDGELAGRAARYIAVVPDAENTETVLSVNGWDGVRRYTSARQLYDFPLAVIVGLSEQEQLAAVNRQARTYLWRAAGGSLVLVLLVLLMMVLVLLVLMMMMLMVLMVLIVPEQPSKRANEQPRSTRLLVGESGERSRNNVHHDMYSTCHVTHVHVT